MIPDSAASSPAEGSAPGVDPSLPDVLARVGRLEVRAKRVVEGMMSGRHDNPYLGRSLDFREHRAYTPGDDLRDVDWKVWARQDRLYVKQYDAETNLRASLLVDCSASMAYRDPGEELSKHDFAATAACALAFLLTRQHDAVGCLALAEGVVAETPHRSGRNQVTAIAETLVRPAEGAKTDMADCLAKAASSLPRRGMVILLSDLFCPSDELAKGLSLLRARGADAVVLQVLAGGEIEFPFEGPTRFVGLEDDHRLDANPQALRRDYLRALERHQSAVRKVCGRERADYQLLRTDRPLESALVALLARRATRRR